jgi:hypothetical protein
VWNRRGFVVHVGGEAVELLKAKTRQGVSMRGGERAVPAVRASTTLRLSHRNWTCSLDKLAPPEMRSYNDRQKLHKRDGLWGGQERPGTETPMGTPHSSKTDGPCCIRRDEQVGKLGYARRFNKSKSKSKDKKKLMPFQSRKKASHQWTSRRNSTLRRIGCERLRK